MHACMLTSVLKYHDESSSPKTGLAIRAVMTAPCQRKNHMGLGTTVGRDLLTAGTAKGKSLYRPTGKCIQCCGMVVILERPFVWF